MTLSFALLLGLVLPFAPVAEPTLTDVFVPKSDGFASIRALRKTSLSTDGGVTSSRVTDVAEQVDPGCMASILRYTDPKDGRKSRLVYSGRKARDGRTAGCS